MLSYPSERVFHCHAILLSLPTECSSTGFIRRFNGAILSVVSDVPVDSESPVVTSSFSRFVGPTQFFGGAHRGRVCVCAYVHRGECALCM